MYLRQSLFCLFFLLLLIFFEYGCSSKGDDTNSDRVWGFKGGLPGRFSSPRAIDYRNGILYIIDKTGRVQKFREDGSFILEWRLEKIDNGTPTSLTIDEDGSLWIPDTHNSRILHYSSEGEFLFSFGKFGKEDGDFVYPTDLVFGQNEELIIAEYGSHDRIQIFTREGEFITSWGEFGSGRGQFNRPMAITRSQDDLLFVADSANHRLKVYTDSGELQRIIGKEGEGEGEFRFPYDIEFDGKGRLYVCEFGNNRVQCISTDGTCLKIWGETGSAVGQFITPWGVAIGGGKLFVVDTKNHRIQLFPL